jgi:Tfp pilus assembly protein PilF
MRKINGKLFLALLLGSGLLAGGLFVLHRFQRDRIAQALLFQAKKAEEEGLNARSASYRQRYLDFNRTDHDEMAMLAKQWIGDGVTSSVRDRQRAIALLDKVLSHVEDRELRLLMVQTSLSVRDFLQARDHLTRLLPLERVMEAVVALRAGNPLTPENPIERGQLEAYWGQLLEAEKKSQEALDCYRLAIRNAPSELLPYVRVAYLQRRKLETVPSERAKNIAEADAAIDALVQKNDALADAYLTRWRYRRDFDLLQVRETANKGQISLDDAAEDIAQALRRKPDSIDALLCAADLERLRGRAAAEDPTRNAAQRQAGLKVHREKAFEYLNRGLDTIAKKQDARNPEESGKFQLLWHKANLLLDELDSSEPEKIAAQKPLIEETIDQIRKTRINGSADYLTGRLALLERKWAEAAALFELSRTLLAGQPDLAAQADLFLGQCYGRLQEHTQMYNAFKRVSDWDPSSVAARIGMAEARAAQGKLEEARREFDVLLRNSQIPARALIDVARLELQRQMTSSKPNWANCEELMRLAEEANPRAVVEIPLLRAEMFMRQNKPDQAKRELAAARDRCPDEVDLWAAMVDCAVRRKKPDEARKILADAQERVGDPVGLRLARVRMLETEGKLSQKEVESLAQRAADYSDADQSRLLSGMADACLRGNQPGLARMLYERLGALPAYKNDLRLQLLMFDMALRDEDEANMDRILATIKTIEQQSGTYHRYGIALKTIFRARRTTGAAEREQLLLQAKTELDAVQKARPSWASVSLARAEIASLEDNPEAAIKHLQDAFKNGENGPGVVRKLVALLMQKGRTDEAQQLLGQLNSSLIAGKEMRNLAVGLAIRSNDVARALDIARSAIQDDTRDPAELVYMARVLAANQKYDEAEKKINEALALAPANPGAHLAKVQYLMERRRKAEIPAALAAIQEQVPEKARTLLLAQCYEISGDYRKAVEFFDAAAKQGANEIPTLKTIVQSHLATGRFALAEPILRRILSGRIPNTPPLDQAWAKRNLALVLAGSTDYRRFTEALDLVGLKLEVDGKLAEVDERNASSDTLRTRARVLASQAQKQFRDQAIRLLEALDRRGDLNGEDRFTLAMLYEADGKTERSQKNLRELTQPPLRSPRYLAQYAMSLLASRRDSDALLEVESIVEQLADLEKLRETGPNGFASVEIQTRLLEARQKETEALELMTKHVRRPTARPEEIVLLIGTLSRQKRFDEAFATCEAEWQKAACPPEVLGAVTSSLLRVMNPSDAQMAQMEQWLTKANSADKPSATLRMQLADVLDRRGKYAEAASQWREVLQADPNNFVAMNNLAWQLVTHGGDAQEALAFVEKALGGMGQRPDLLDTRGLVYLSLKQPEKALADFQRAATEGPTPTRLLHLAQAQHQLKDREAAKATLQKAKENGLELAKLHPTEQEQARLLLKEYGL